LQKLRNCIICLSVGLCARMKHLCSHWVDFLDNLFWRVLLKPVDVIQLSLKSDITNGHFERRPKCIFESMQFFECLPSLLYIYNLLRRWPCILSIPFAAYCWRLSLLVESVKCTQTFLQPNKLWRVVIQGFLTCSAKRTSKYLGKLGILEEASAKCFVLFELHTKDTHLIILKMAWYISTLEFSFSDHFSGLL
jgi:hypothetical protein